MRALRNVVKRVDSFLDMVSDLVNFYFLVFVSLVILAFKCTGNVFLDYVLLYSSFLVLFLGLAFMFRSVCRAAEVLGVSDAKPRIAKLLGLALVFAFAIVNSAFLYWFLRVYFALLVAEVTIVQSILGALNDVSAPMAAMIFAGNAFTLTPMIALSIIRRRGKHGA